MAHFAEHLGKGGMEKLWATFGSLAFDDATCKLLVDQAKQFYGDRSIEGLAEDHDKIEMEIINAIANVESNTGA
ncbi:hypothetical protein WL99_12435 [Burkholderia cepacia]|uniref:hypothetical protein n=1 Tax=Burkholderia cepacia TaxID=292 RepID=UPI00075C1469|nr:hypothetical protein [Burkholderia cepacia]KWH31890.1 hypothetical protein WL99_12435 [Burkholderia cepacia]